MRLTFRIKIILWVATSRTSIKGRHISNNCILAHEILRYFKKKKKKKEEEITWVKAQYCNTYNRMKWNVINKVLEAFGCYKEFIEIIRGCISTLYFEILFNGSPSEKLYPFGGVTQEDPLFIYLFINWCRSLIKNVV